MLDSQVPLGRHDYSPGSERFHHCSIYKRSQPWVRRPPKHFSARLFARHSARALETQLKLQHDPNRHEDLLRVDADSR